MGKILKWIGIVLGAIIGLIVVALVVVFVVSGYRMNKTYGIAVESVSVPTGAESIAQGEHLAVTRGCTDCHGENLAGQVFLEDSALGRIVAANLTAGTGGVGGSYSNEDWVRALRHGVNPTGKPLLFMPSQEFYYLTDNDLGALIAYMKSIPPVDNETPTNSVAVVARVMWLAGVFDLLPAELIDHEGPRPQAPAVGVTAEYGEYLAVGCVGCHGADLSGGPVPGAPPDWPPAANLTPAGHLANWSEDEFLRALRTGVKPNGEEFDETMPFAAVGQMTDDELKAVWLYLQSLPAKETTTK